MITVPISEVHFNNKNIKVIYLSGNPHTVYYGMRIGLYCDNIIYDTDTIYSIAHDYLRHIVLLLELSEEYRKKITTLLLDTSILFGRSP